jgi:hypothetical protein
MFTYHMAEMSHRTRAEWLASIGSDEITGWRAYLKSKPPTFQEYQIAALLYMFSRGFMGNKKSKYEDYLPKGSTRKKKRSPEEWIAMFLASGAKYRDDVQ